MLITFCYLGRVECVYEPAMTKAFLHGRTEAIRSVQPESVEFTKVLSSHPVFSIQCLMENFRHFIPTLRLRRRCQLYARLVLGTSSSRKSAARGWDRTGIFMLCTVSFNASSLEGTLIRLPMIQSHGPQATRCQQYSLILVGNCSALPYFPRRIVGIPLYDCSDLGLLPGMAMGLDISSKKTDCPCAFFFCFRFFIRFDDLTRNAWRASCASSKHLQTRRFLHTLQGYLCDIQRLLIQLHRSANERPAPFVDHTGILRDSKTGRPINGYTSNEVSDEEEITMREFRPCTDQLYCG